MHSFDLFDLLMSISSKTLIYFNTNSFYLNELTFQYYLFWNTNRKKINKCTTNASDY